MDSLSQALSRLRFRAVNKFEGDHASLARLLAARAVKRFPSLAEVEQGLKILVNSTPYKHPGRELAYVTQWLLEIFSERFPHSRSIALQLARHYRAMNLPESELLALRRASAFKTTPHLRTRTGVCLYHLKEYAEAISILSALLAEGLLQIEDYLPLAECHIALGQLESATAILERSLQLRPENVPTTILLAQTLLKRGENEEAAAQLLVGTASSVNGKQAIEVFRTLVQELSRPSETIVFATNLSESKLSDKDALEIGLWMFKHKEHALTVRFLSSVPPSRLSESQKNRFLTSQLLVTVPMQFRTLRAGAALHRVLGEGDIQTVLDVGSGGGEHAQIFSDYGKQVTCVDFGKSVYFRASKVEKIALMQGDYSKMSFESPFDLVWASHVLEHQTDTHAFLSKLKSDCRPGGLIAITVPPLKHAIVGGHVSLWNAGLLLYNLVLAGINCSNAQVLNYGYNISIIVRNTPIPLPALDYDAGDIERLAEFLPPGCVEGFDGRMLDYI